MRSTPTDGKPVHAELTLRGTTLMLGPESEQMGRRSAKSVGASPATLYIYVENADKVVEKAAKLGATPSFPRNASSARLFSMMSGVRSGVAKESLVRMEGPPTINSEC